MVLFHLDADTHLRTLTRHAYVAVDFFFVLSGFVLMSAWGERLRDRAALRRFAFRRLTRLYPLHLATLGVLFLLIGWEAWRTGGSVFAASHGLVALVQCLALVQGFTPKALSWNFPSWSVSLELWGSLLFGVVLWLAGARAWMASAAIALALAALVLTLGEPAGPATTEGGAVLKAAHYLMAFFAGAALFKLFAIAVRRAWSPPGYAEWLAVVVVVGLFLFADRVPSPVSVGLFALVILVFAHESGPCSAWLRRRAPQALGRWSYSIYLVHPFWTIATFKLLSDRGLWRERPLSLGGVVAMDLAAVACLVAVVATASLTYRFIERPGMRWVGFRFEKAPRVAPARSQRAPSARAT